MPMVTLDEVKLHTKVSGTAEDALLQTYIDAAEGFITRYCGQDFAEELPAVVKVACLMVVAGMYEGRQHVISTEGHISQVTVNKLVYDYLVPNCHSST
ncbi:MAG: head-tail connector protein [Desulfovibrio sp.]|jgi:uncharacterized phage protein (predicted DNA packaging)|nr:head-tail connector protein [Desulfovibrio sp.]